MQQLVKQPDLVSRNYDEEIADQFDKNLTLEKEEVVEEVEADDDADEEEDGGDFEFFVGGGDTNSPVSAEDIFLNGQIRPVFPFSDEKDWNSEEATTSYRPPVRKVFVVSSTAPESDGVAEGPYCAWSSEKPPEKTVDPAPEMSRKSNSTGFSKLWRVRDLLVRSHSDGKDAFVFLTGKNEEKIETAPSTENKKKKKKVNVANIKVGKGVETTAYCEKKGKKSAYEVLYGKKEKKAGKSYLPYRQELVGFFTNASGISRNVHPY